MTPEFNLIQQYFTRPARHTDLSVGDDAALIAVQHGHQLAISVDTSVAGTHFFEDCQPFFIGWKSMAVNVSDMAAMGATPKWATLALTLPKVDHDWLAEFSKGLFACADSFSIDLIGGDTTRGPLNVSVTIMGQVPLGQALKRGGAMAADDIWVSGKLGLAAIGLRHLQQHESLEGELLETSLNALHQPQARVDLGLSLRGVANSCIDISDGLLADLGHILKASNVGAKIMLEQVPTHAYLQAHLDSAAVQTALLAGGDDYELCFTSPKAQRETIFKLSKALSLPLTCIGEITQAPSLMVQYQQQPLKLNTLGFDHFG
jgi:thiamine-monophosphate kinase